MQDYENKLRYFVIGEDKPINNKKIQKCRDFGIIETEYLPNNEIPKSVESNITNNEVPKKPKTPQTINGHTYLGGIFDSMKASGITIVTSDDIGK